MNYAIAFVGVMGGRRVAKLQLKPLGLFGAENETEAERRDQIKLRIGCRLQAAVASTWDCITVHLRMSQTHQLRFRELACEIVEIETLRLTLLIKRDH